MALLAHIHMPSHPTLQCPRGFSLIAGTEAEPFTWEPMRNPCCREVEGGGGSYSRDAPSQQAIDRDCPSAPARKTKLKLSGYNGCAN